MLLNRVHSVIFEIVSKYCISDSFVDHDGHSISSERFLPEVVDIMVLVFITVGASPMAQRVKNPPAMQKTQEIHV